MRKFKIKYIVLILIFTAASIFAQTRICHFCGKEIKNESYITAAGKYFHQNHFKCEACGKKIAGVFFEENGKFYDEDCHTKIFADKCSFCGKPITGTFLISDGKKYHQECYENHAAPRCALCGEIINGRYFLDYWGNKYHDAHRDKSPQCDYCGRMISNNLTHGGYRYSDGRNICGLCNTEAVTSGLDAENLTEKVKAILARNGLRIDKNDIKIKLVDRNELNRLSSPEIRNDKIRGFAHEQYKTLNGVKIEQNFTIYYLAGMPRKDFEITAAHELMHIWQYLNCENEVDKQFSEGSCEYAANIYINNQNGKYWDYLNDLQQKNNDPVYGTGFKRVQNLVEKKGKDFWLNYLKNKGSLPPGY